MKKARFMVLALVVAVMLIGAGYAYVGWDEFLQVDETVNMGDVNIQWWWMAVTPDANGVFNSTGSDGLHSSASDAVTEDGDTTDYGKFTVNLNNLYPGAEVKWDGQMKNVGTIPVKITDVNLTYDTTDADINAVLDYLEVKYRWACINHGVSTGQQYMADGTSHWIPLRDLATDMKANTGLMNNVVAGYDATIAGNDNNKYGWLSFGTEEIAPEEISPECITIRVAEDAPESIQKLAAQFTLDFTIAQAPLN